jgi:hypothetical protein
MDESEQRSIEVDEGEARTIVSALERDKPTKDRREEERLENIARQFQREFGLGERGDDEGDFTDMTPGSFEGDLDITGDSDSRSVGLSRGEAESVIDALSASETSEPAGEKTTQEIEERFESTFDLGENGGEGESD